jgi:hypothetical protein
MVNPIIKELWWAASVVDRFSTIQTMQNQLFTAARDDERRLRLCVALAVAAAHAARFVRSITAGA